MKRIQKNLWIPVLAFLVAIVAATGCGAGAHDTAGAAVASGADDSGAGVAKKAGGKSAADERYAKARSMEPADQLIYLRGLEDAGDHSAELNFHMGNAFYSLEQGDSAIARFLAATMADSTYSKAWVNLGITYDTVHSSSKARAAYERAIAVNPQDVLAYCHLGFNYFEKGDADRAVKLYTRALEIDPESAQAHYNLGLAFADAKLFKEALVEWNRVIEIDPDGALGKVAAENVGMIESYLKLEN